MLSLLRRFSPSHARRYGGRSATAAENVSMSAGILAILALLAGTALVVVSPATTPAYAAPGNPGIPGDPEVVYEEDFENRQPNTNILLTDYTGVSGATYTGDGYWVSRPNCNGFIINQQSPRDPSDCGGPEHYNNLSAVPYALGVLRGAADPAQNAAAASYTSGSAADNLVQFRTVNPLPLVRENRFLTFSVDAGAMNCHATHPELRFYLLDANGNEIPVSNTAIDPCDDPRATELTVPRANGTPVPVSVGSFAADSSILVDGDNFGIVLRNENGNGGGNDGAYDNIRVLDVTPQLDKEFAPSRVPVGESSRLTLTVTNTSELAEKGGWGFTDRLPQGLVLAGNPNLSTTCTADIDAPAGGSAITVTNGTLATGVASCTISVDVTSEAPRGADESPVTYVNGPDNIEDNRGLNPPDPAEVEFYSEPVLNVTKSSDASVETRVGNTVTYTVEATNTGTGDFTSQNPAVVLDDLSGVLDDGGIVPGSLKATVDGQPVSDPVVVGTLLSWSGPLAAGKTVVIEYQVELRHGGDREVKNVAWPGDTPPDPNDPPTTPDCGDDGVACEEFDLPGLTIVKSADKTELPEVGETLTYTVTVTNVGPGNYTASAPALVEDDLSDVLDDAALVDGSLSSTVGAAPAIDGTTLKWSGPLTAGQTTVLTYTVTYTGEGNQELINSACVLGGQAVDGLDCDSTITPGSDLTWGKTSVSSDDPLVAGSTVTYTLWFKNDGKAAATVDHTDYLGYVLDDASVVDGSVSADDGLTASLNGDELGVTGSVPAGDRLTVTYQVEVLPDGDRGDDRLVNHLLDGDEEIPPPPSEEDECEDTDTSTCSPIAAVAYEKTVAASDDPIEAGTVLTYTITVTNTGATAGPVDREDVLSDVLDDAELTAAPQSDNPSVTVSQVQDGRFHIGGQLAPDETATITYQVTVKPETERGDNLAGNFLVPPGEVPPQECEADNPECTETPLPNVLGGKLVDAGNEETVLAGDEVTYTLVFENTGQAAGKVDFTDDLSGVLDDADLIDGPVVVDGGLNAQIADGTIQVTGALDPGQTGAVEYTVKVKADGERGDNQLENAIVKTGTDECVPVDGSECSTTNPIPEIADAKSVNPASGTPVVPGQELAYTIEYVNTGKAAGTVDRVDSLVHVLDDAELIGGPDVDGGLTAVLDGEVIRISGELGAGDTATVTYTVKVKDSDRGDDVLANFVLDPDQEVPEDPNEACEENNDHATCNPVGDIKPGKSVNPESGTEVDAGEVLTYTLSFENTGKGAAQVAYTDHLAEVLDDAEWVGIGEVSEGLSVDGPQDGTLQITGTVEPGATGTVTYQVKVNPHAERGDGAVANFLVPDGQEPPTECVEDNPLCTSNPVSEPPAQPGGPGKAGGPDRLPFTGTELSALLAALVLLAAGGSALYLSRRKRGTAGADQDN
ncbi:hypothetical protein GCM10027079_25890 [Sediminivirga luteola]|uniref:DUF11 domain-containing protein n=1 Tax=Sediminivirga luteola TaxID=1774748 RepID=A0A8J2U0S3_9MICO|nr:hypothetical protein GCM10011333_30850 [Sediminivirga luteola]